MTLDSRRFHHRRRRHRHRNGIKKRHRPSRSNGCAPSIRGFTTLAGICIGIGICISIGITSVLHFQASDLFASTSVATVPDAPSYVAPTRSTSPRHHHNEDPRCSSECTSDTHEDAFPWSQRPRFIWGVLSDTASQANEWRQQLRQTYLRTIFEASHDRPQDASIYEQHQPLVCALHELEDFVQSQANRTTESPSTMATIRQLDRFRSCRIFYTFVVSSTDATGDVRDTTQDILSLPTSSERPLAVAWFHHAATNIDALDQLRGYGREASDHDATHTAGHPTSFISAIDSHSIVHPVLFLDYIDSVVFQQRLRQAESAHGMQFGSTAFVDTHQCFSNRTFHDANDEACDNPTGLIQFGTAQLSAAAVETWSAPPQRINGRQRTAREMQILVLLRLRESMRRHGNAIETSFVHLPRTAQLHDPEDVASAWRWLCTPRQRHFHRKNTLTQAPSDDDERWWHELRALQPDIHRNLLYVTGKFGRKPHTFFTHVQQGGRQYLVQQQQRQNPRKPRNFPMMHDTSTQIWSFDTFPDFIKHDARWRDHHLQFTKNASASARGGGHWFFKAPLVEYAIQYLQATRHVHDAFLIYSDIDQYWNASIVSKIMHTMQAQNASLAIKHTGTRHLERQYTKGIVYARICNHYHPGVRWRSGHEEASVGPGMRVDDDASYQYKGGWMMIRLGPNERRADDGKNAPQPNSGILRFVRAWVAWIASDYEVLLTDMDTSHMAKNSADFVEHRHDQSVISMLLKCYRDADAEADTEADTNTGSGANDGDANEDGRNEDLGRPRKMELQFENDPEFDHIHLFSF